MALIGSNCVFKGARKILFKIRDLIFPVFCISCDQEGQVICQRCLNGLGPRPQFLYPANSGLDKVIALGDYQDGILQKAIVEYKYNFQQEFFVVFQKIIDDWVLDEEKFWEGRRNYDWLILPVPLHKSRLWERGFNQAEEIARAVSGKLGLKMNNQILKRIKKTQRQVGLGKRARLGNLAGAFAVGRDLAGGNIILIDDVFTTGATLQECAKVCKGAGAAIVWGLTLARER